MVKLNVGNRIFGKQTKEIQTNMKMRGQSIKQEDKMKCFIAILFKFYGNKYKCLISCCWEMSRGMFVQ